MARADLLCDMIKFGINNDVSNFRKAAEAICAEERSKQHTVLAAKIEDILRSPSKQISRETIIQNIVKSGDNSQSLIWEKSPRKRLDSIVLPKNILDQCTELIEEQLRSDLLRSYGLEPRNRLLLVGPPGNGKTSLAEAIAESLMIPLITVRYESVIGSYLGETANRLSKLFEYAKTRQCVLFFDEFETLGKERGDIHETGEIKRVVSSLLLQIDSLPSYVVVIAATNHESLLDSAAWRRFQLKLELPKPTKNDIELWLSRFQKQKNFSFEVPLATLSRKTLGLSFADIEEFSLSVYRQYVLNSFGDNAKRITEINLNRLRNFTDFSLKESNFEGDNTCLKDQ